MGKDFVSLHNHTEYSLLDGAAKTSKIFKQADELGQSAVAITDHGNMYGVLAFIKAAVRHTDSNADFFEFLKEKRKFKVKPIIGCEFYICEDIKIKQSDNVKLNHLVLLAKNETGYKNLIKLNSVSFISGFYHKPRIDFSLLEKHSDGLICLSACLAGELSQAALTGGLEKARAVAKKYKRLFNNDYYIEIQDHFIAEQSQILPTLVAISKEENIKLVATNDTHYLKKEDWAMHKVLLNISFRSSFDPSELDKNENQIMAETANSSDDDYFPTREFYLKSRKEMEGLFPSLAEALDNTIEVANKCEDCYYFSKKPLFPEFTTKNSESAADMLIRLTFEGLKKRYTEITQEVKKRADYELDLIIKLGFADYFLIVWDFILYAEKSNIAVGPGRGSGVGSIVAYALGITKLDPLKYGLIFERFLNPDRVSNPDFDIDFCVDGRDRVIEYVTNKYGSENVSQIITFGSLKAKAAIKDVGRVFNVPFAHMNELTKLFPKLFFGRLEHILGFSKFKDKTTGELLDLTVPELKDMYENDSSTKRIFDMAMQIEGLPRQTGIHAAGVIVCKNPIYMHIPQSSQKSPLSDERVTTTQFDMNECEQLGLLKMDFLGLRTLTDIANTLSEIKRVHKKNINFYTMKYNDEQVYQLISEGDTHAVFQFEGGGMTRFMKNLKPTHFEDLIAGVALFRPGPMQYIDTYIKGKHDRKSVKYDHPMLEPILNVTYGVMVYQEQVIAVAQQLAGYSVSEGDNLRYLISKKKSKLFEKEREKFVNGCVKNEIPKNIAAKIFDDILRFGNYAFNKSHAAAYAALAYQTAYLKKHYPVQFITAVLNNRISNIDEVANYLKYLKEKEVKVLPPCVNESEAKFSTTKEGSVRVGLVAVKNVGSSIIDAIILERQKNGKFSSFVDFAKRMSFITINKRMLEALIFTGAFDCFSHTRNSLIHSYDVIISRIAKEKQRKEEGQFSFFENDYSTENFEFVKKEELPLSKKLQYEKENAGIYLSGHPLEEYSEFLSSFKLNSNSLKFKEPSEEDEEVYPFSDGERISFGGMLVSTVSKITKNGKRLGVGTLEDLYGTKEILLSESALKDNALSFVSDTMVSIEGSVNIKDDNITIWVRKIIPIGSEKKVIAGKKIYLSFNINNSEILDEVQEILLAYPGKDEVFVQSTHDSKKYQLEIKTDFCPQLEVELLGLSENVKYKII